MIANKGIGGSIRPAAYTEAAMPTASAANSGVTVFNSTYNVMMRSNGTRWIPLSPFRVYVSGALTDAHTGNTNKTSLRAVTLPLKYVGAKGRLKFAAASTNTNNGNNKTLTVSLWDGTTESDIFAGASTTTGKTVAKSVYSADSESSQWFNNAGSSAETSVSASPAAASLNYASGTAELRVYGTLASAGDTITLTRLTVDIYPGF